MVSKSWIYSAALVYFLAVFGFISLFQIFSPYPFFVAAPFYILVSPVIFAKRCKTRWGRYCVALVCLLSALFLAKPYLSFWTRPQHIAPAHPQTESFVEPVLLCEGVLSPIENIPVLFFCLGIGVFSVILLITIAGVSYLLPSKQQSEPPRLLPTTTAVAAWCVGLPILFDFNWQMQIIYLQSFIYFISAADEEARLRGLFCFGFGLVLLPIAFSPFVFDKAVVLYGSLFYLCSPGLGTILLVAPPCLLCSWLFVKEIRQRFSNA